MLPTWYPQKPHLGPILHLLLFFLLAFEFLGFIWLEEGKMKNLGFMGTKGRDKK